VQQLQYESVEAKLVTLCRLVMKLHKYLWMKSGIILVILQNSYIHTYIYAYIHTYILGQKTCNFSAKCNINPHMYCKR